MGEARRRQSLGLPPKTRRCPVVRCRSRHVRPVPAHFEISQKLARAWGCAATDHEVCMSCGAIWEALPRGWRSDSVERAKTVGPCDNCAYRATSRETRDPEERQKLLEHAKLKAVAIGDGVLSLPRGQFCCHKGVPIVLRDGALSYDYSAAGIDPASQSCAGWLRVMWAERENGNGFETICAPKYGYGVDVMLP